MDAMNRMTAKQLTLQQGDSIRIFRNPRTGTVGFVCGTIQGRCTHKLSHEITCGNSLSINDLEYCVRVYPNTTIPELGISHNPTIVLTIE